MIRSDTTPEPCRRFYPENEPGWHAIANVLDAARRVFITTHVNPDGDAIGSELALARFLMKRGRTVRIINQSKTPALYLYLDRESMIESYEIKGEDVFRDPPGADDVVVILDLSDFDRMGAIGKFFIESGARRIVIDHHESEPEDADISVLTPYAESTGSLVYDLILCMDQSLIDAPIAEAVLTAVLTDTGYFSFTNTSSISLDVVSSLYRHGVSVHSLRKKIEATQPLIRQRLLGLCLSRVALACGGRVAWSSISTDMFRESGASREHTEGIINHIRIIEGIAIAVLFIQDGPAEWKLSFRSVSGIRVNSIAGAMGGGGHEKAAGASLRGSLPEVTAKAFTIIGRALDL